MRQALDGSLSKQGGRGPVQDRTGHNPPFADEVEREAHRERVHGPALGDVERDRGGHPVELREALQAGGAGVPSSGLNGDSRRRDLIDVPSVGSHAHLSDVSARQCGKMR